MRIRAERKAGELLHESAKNGTRATAKGNLKQGPKSKGATSAQMKLSDHGISKDQSSDWQKLASIPRKQFEMELKKPGVPSTNQILENHYPKKKEPSPIENVDRDALAAWGVIVDFAAWHRSSAGI